MQPHPMIVQRRHMQVDDDGLDADGDDAGEASGRLGGRAASGQLSDGGRRDSLHSSGGMLSLPTFKAQRRSASGDLESEVRCIPSYV